MKEKYELYAKIADRAEQMGYDGERISLMMDIESADKKFNLRLEELLNADKANFAHDINGIINNIVRDEFPAKDFGLFVPRYAGRYNVNLEDVVDLDALTKANNEAMRKVIDFMVGERGNDD